MSRFVGNTRDWRPADVPDLTDVVMWPDGPWNEPLDGEVDEAVTAALASMPGNPRVRTNHGIDGSGGVPYQFPETSNRVIRSDVASHGISTERVPLPSKIRRTGDPAGKNTDRQAFIVEPSGRALWELSSLDNTVWGLLFGARFQASMIARWDLDVAWDLNRHGVTAAKLPMVPMLPRPEEFARGWIGHALQLSTFYRPSEVVGYARGSDGQTPSSPLVAGMQLRIRGDRFSRLAEIFAHCPDVVTLLVALREYGVVVSDRTGPTAGSALRLPQTTQIDLGGLALVITDFEIVRTH